MSTTTSLEKGLRILRELAASDQGMHAADIAQATALNRSTVYRLCEVLERGGWIAHSDVGRETTRFALGPTFEGLAFLVSGKNEMGARLRPILANLSRELGETVHMAVLEHDAIIHVAREIPDLGVHVAAPLGSRAPAHASALGKALLATLSDEEVRSLFVTDDLPVFAPNTIATVTDLLRDLQRTRERGYAEDDQESRLGIRCVAVPVFDPAGDARFAISVTTLPQRLDGDSVSHVVHAVKAAAGSATSSIGGRVPDLWGTSSSLTG
jgi:IclR family acetate operon transcriptional repressor